MVSSLRSEIEEQRAANQSALPFSELYSGHREHLTTRILAGNDSSAELSLCILGAGNCYDIDLEKLTSAYQKVHLVDLDEEALLRAREGVPSALRSRIFCHAPLDLSGMLTRLERWKKLEVTPEELIRHPEGTADALALQLGATFDVVVSACVMSQMQLSVLNTLGDRHQLFQAVRHTLSVTHLRTLARLIRPGGRGVFAADVVASDHLPIEATASPSEIRSVFDRIVSEGNVIYVSHPGVLRAIALDDPALKRQIELGGIADVWLWRQGPQRTFMVYALDINRRPTA